MVQVLKFSQFAQANLSTTTNKLVGVNSLSGGLNVYTSLFNTWTTATRPSPPAIGMYGYNTDLPSLESFNGSIWVPVGSGGFGTVSNVATGTGLTGGPITTTGTISFAAIAANSLWANTNSVTAVPTVIPLSTFLAASNNLSDLANIATARTNLGLVIGSTVEAWNVQLDQIAGGVWPGASSITTLGTISSGMWNASNIALNKGGTNSSLTAINGGMVYSTASALAISPALTNGQLMIGSTGSVPAPTTLTAGSNISIVNGANSITISATGLAGFSWNTVTGTSVNLLPNNGYFMNNAGLVTGTLPATSAVGDEIDIMGIGTGGWKIQAGIGQTIVVGSSTSASAGFIQSKNAKDSCYLICTVANTQWQVGSGSQGVLSVDGTNNSAVNSPLFGTTGTGNFVGSTTPTITTPIIVSGLYDSNFNAYISFISDVGSIPSNFRVKNAASGNPVILDVVSTDTNVGMQINGKGNLGVAVKGVGTNVSATAGYIGEEKESIIPLGSLVSLTTTVAANLTSISLTAGDWDVWGNIFFSIGGNSTFNQGWLSDTSATLPDLSLVNQYQGLALQSQGMQVPSRRFILSSTTTIYLSARAAFTTSTVGVAGGLYARRRS